MAPRDENPTAGEMISEILDLTTGFGIMVLPLIILAIPALVLLMPLAVLAVPFAILVAPILLIRALRRHDWKINTPGRFEP